MNIVRLDKSADISFDIKYFCKTGRIFRRNDRLVNHRHIRRQSEIFGCYFIEKLDSDRVFFLLMNVGGGIGKFDINRSGIFGVSV